MLTLLFLLTHPPIPTFLAKADSGASSHYFRQNDQHALSRLHPTPFGPTVMLSDSTHTRVTQTGKLSLHSSLSAKAKQAHILDGITNSSLISLGQLCDDNCVAILDKTKINIFKHATCILSGPRNPTTDASWDIPLPLAQEGSKKAIIPSTSQRHHPQGPNQNGTGTVSLRMLRQPCRIHLEKGHSERQLHHMARHRYNLPRS
jgi:hypothetical protein